MKAKNLRELFEEELKDIYWAEKELTEAIPKTISQASSKDLINALEEHLKITKNQIKRLEKVFDALGMEAEGKKCEAMEGLIKEADEIIEDTQKGSIRDAGIISAVQKVEHYEIASYGTLRSFANILGEDKVVKLLEETLNEEKEADSILTDLAVNKINHESANK
jgi:ferritin-like metal-binding protein YciE